MNFFPFSNSISYVRPRSSFLIIRPLCSHFPVGSCIQTGLSIAKGRSLSAELSCEVSEIGNFEDNSGHFSRKFLPKNDVFGDGLFCLSVFFHTLNAILKLRTPTLDSRLFKERILISTKPFDLWLYGEDTSWRIPLSSQNLLNGPRNCGPPSLRIARG